MFPAFGQVYICADDNDVVMGLEFENMVSEGLGVQRPFCSPRLSCTDEYIIFQEVSVRTKTRGGVYRMSHRPSDDRPDESNWALRVERTCVGSEALENIGGTWNVAEVYIDQYRP